MLSAIIIDDEPKAIEVLEHLINHIGAVNIIDKETNPNKGLRSIMVNKPDVVFLDMNMPEKSGISFLKELKELNVSIKVIVVSAFDKYTFEAFKYSASDFLQKPVVLDELREIIDRLNDQQSKEPDLNTTVAKFQDVEKIKLVSGTKILFLKPEQIIYLTADGNYTKAILMGGKEELITTGIGKIAEELPKVFFKISRSVIINSTYLSALIKRNRTCVLNDELKEYKLKASVNPFYELESNFVSKA